MSKSSMISTIDLFPKLDAELHTLLTSLSGNDWERQTVSPWWTVKDIAAHLLDGNIRAISIYRDQYFGEKPGNIDSYSDLVDYLNALNSDWVRAMKRVSPEVITSLLHITGKDYGEILRTLKPFEKAVFPVSWAGEEESFNWFHIAREYTEKWHHQQQIRLAVGQTEPLYSRELYYPYLDTSMRALPYHYRGINADNGAIIKFTVSGEGGGDWFLAFQDGHWLLVSLIDVKAVCSVMIDGEIAWRMFTRGISKSEAKKFVHISGIEELGEHIFSLLAVMA